MGRSYSLLSTSDDNDLLTTAFTNDRISSRPDSSLQIREPLHFGTINTLASAQNDIVISAGADKQIVVQDLAAGGFITKFVGHTKEITKLTYKHVENNDFVLSGSLDETIRLWQFGVPTPIGIYHEDGMIVSGLAAIDENTIISGSEDEKIRLWDINSQKPLRTIHIANNFVTHISKSPLHEIIAQSSMDKTLKIWDARSLEVVFKSPVKAFPLLHCDFLDGMYCITSSSGNQFEGCEISLWDLRQQRIVHNFYGHHSPVKAAIFLPQQVTWKKLIFSISDDHKVFVWDKDQGVSLWQETLPGFGQLNCCAGFTDGGIAIGGSDGYLCTMKLFSKAGKVFLSSQSVQASFYQSLQAAQDLESIGLT